ncbi:hypothetical protein GCM10009573_24370 [Agromyces bracchium]
MRRFLRSTEAAYFTGDPGFRSLRNYSMHCGIRDPALALDPDAPMFGLIEALTATQAPELWRRVSSTTHALCDLLREWCASH